MFNFFNWTGLNGDNVNNKKRLKASYVNSKESTFFQYVRLNVRLKKYKLNN